MAHRNHVEQNCGKDMLTQNLNLVLVVLICWWESRLKHNWRSHFLDKVDIQNCIFGIHKVPTLSVYVRSSIVPKMQSALFNPNVDKSKARENHFTDNRKPPISGSPLQSQTIRRLFVIIKPIDIFILFWAIFVPIVDQNHDQLLQILHFFANMKLEGQKNFGCVKQDTNLFLVELLCIPRTGSTVQQNTLHSTLNSRVRTSVEKLWKERLFIPIFVISSHTAKTVTTKWFKNYETKFLYFVCTKTHRKFWITFKMA